MFRNASYSHDTSATSGLRGRRRGDPHDHPTFAPMSRPTSPANIRPHDLPDNPPEGSSDDGEVAEG